jgi:hypothetical protein
MVEVKTPILVRLGSRLSVFRKGQDVQQPTGTLENVVIRNVKAESSDSTQLKPASGILITGVPGHDVTSLTLENVEIDLPGGGTLENSNVQVPEAVDKYPEVKTFGPTIPAYGLWARHVKGLKLHNISFHLKTNDLRPAFIFDEGKDIEVSGCSLPETTGGASVIRMVNVEGAEIKNTATKAEAEAFVKVEGKSSKKIRLDKNSSKSKKEIELGPDVNPRIVLK